MGTTTMLHAVLNKFWKQHPKKKKKKKKLKSYKNNQDEDASPKNSCNLRTHRFENDQCEYI